MAEPILIYGKSGSGKSRSLYNFKEDEIFLVNVVGKRLPFKKTFKYSMATNKYGKIMEALEKMTTSTDCKVAVIDDAGYLMTSQFMSGHAAPKAGASTFDLFNNIADSFWQLMVFIRKELPKDVRVYMIMHETTTDFNETKVRTIGKLLDDKVCVEGLFTICLHSVVEPDGYFFKVNAGAGINNNDISKAPEGMFYENMIENDLKAVDCLICMYYGFPAPKRDGEKAGTEAEENGGDENA